MGRNLPLKRGLWLSLLVAGIAGYLFGDWRAIALRSTDLSASQIEALRFPNLSAFENVALRFPDLSAFENVALRFPDLSASENVALRFPDLLISQNVSPRFPDLWVSQNVSPRFPEASAVGVPVIPNPTAAESASPTPLFHLIDFQVASALPPIGHSRFCLRYPDDCKVHGIDFRRRNIKLTLERWNELNIINREVNKGISAEATPGNGATEEWVISPLAGNCKNYAITKRHELLARGWPSRALLLSEVVTPSGQHHLLLVVRVKDGDLVLDNLHDEIRLVTTTYDQYLWVRIQSSQNPKFWTRVRRRDAVHTDDAV
jgi:predicted transglutaminase-like cysteine proteinase